MDQPILLKGVNKDEPYPLLYIDTLDHLKTKQVKVLERGVLQRENPPNEDTLLHYLVAYCAVVGTDEIMLKEDSSCDEVPPPESYSQHKELISEHLLGEKGREFKGEANGEDNEYDAVANLEDVELNPLEGEPE